MTIIDILTIAYSIAFVCVCGYWAHKLFNKEYSVETPLTIRIELKDQYGKQVAHPVCDNAKMFADIAGTKILTDMTLLRIAGLGYTIITTQREWRQP